jgi:hypothetical protein
LNEINDIASRPTWATQKQKLIEHVLDHIRILSFHRHLCKLDSNDVKEFLLLDTYETNYPLALKMSLLTQQFIVSVLSQYVVLEIGFKCYKFNKLHERQIEFLDNMTDRFQSLRCRLWECALNAEDTNHMVDFMLEIMNPILKEYSTLIELASTQIASSSLDAEDIRRRYLAVEDQIAEVGKILTESAGGRA